MSSARCRARALLAAVAFVVGAGSANVATARDVLILTQSPVRASAGPSNEQRREDQYLDVLKQLRSQCSNAAWSLWHSNGYEPWRSRKSSMIHMHYSSRSYPSLPQAPQALPEGLRSKLEAALAQANDLLRDSGEAFKQLADYINAKDYEDDKFKKGDAINARLVEAGRTCHRLYADMTGLYTEAAERLIEARRGASAKPDVVATMLADWRKARALSAEMGRFERTDLARLDGLVKEVSTLVDERKADFAPLKENPDGSLKRFYDGILNDDVAVKMRRFLRDAKNPKAFKDAAEDRPRSQFWSIRSEVEVGMPDALLGYIRSAK